MLCPQDIPKQVALYDAASARQVFDRYLNGRSWTVSKLPFVIPFLRIAGFSCDPVTFSAILCEADIEDIFAEYSQQRRRRGQHQIEQNNQDQSAHEPAHNER